MKKSAASKSPRATKTAADMTPAEKADYGRQVFEHGKSHRESAGREPALSADVLCITTPLQFRVGQVARVAECMASVERWGTLSPEDAEQARKIQAEAQAVLDAIRALLDSMTAGWAQ